MVSTASQTTLNILAAFGVYLVAAGLSGVYKPDRWRTIINEFKSSDALSYLAGIVVLALGCAIVMVHNVWADTLSGLVSLIGWGAIAEGILLLAKPEALFSLADPMLDAINPRYVAIPCIIIGLLFTLMGLTGTIDPNLAANR